MIKNHHKKLFIGQYVFRISLLDKISQFSSSLQPSEKSYISKLTNRSLLVIHGPDTYKFLKELSNSDINWLSIKSHDSSTIKQQSGRVSFYTYFFSANKRFITDAFVYRPKMYRNGKKQFKQDQLWIDVHASSKNQLFSHFKEQLSDKKVGLTDVDSEFSQLKPSIFAAYTTKPQINTQTSHIQTLSKPGHQIEIKKEQDHVGSYANLMTTDPRDLNFGWRILSMTQDLRFPTNDYKFVPETTYDHFENTTKQSFMNQIPIFPLRNDKVILTPLVQSDFEKLFKAASDPLIWQQHPNPDRYKREVFQNYFNGAILSKGAFLISNPITQNVIGSTRFYDYDFQARVIKIGYTFYSRNCWGTKINHEVKALMLNYAWNFAEKVNFEVGHKNIRSQIAIQRIGAKKIGEKEIAYFGEPPKVNFIYEIKK